MLTYRSDLLTVVDGRHLLWRAASVHSSLSFGERPTGAIYGFLSVLARVARNHRTRVCVAWDGETNFRKRMFPGYKLREPNPRADATRDSMVDQQTTLMSMLARAGVRQYVGEDCEADDVMGRLAALRRRANLDTWLYGGDSDLAQLAREPIPGRRGAIALLIPKKRKDLLVTASEVEEHFGVGPRQIVGLKALAGDSSDKIPGVPGIGAVGARALLREHGSLAGVCAAAMVAPLALRAARPDPRLAKVASVGVDVGLWEKLATIRLDCDWTEVRTRLDVGRFSKALNRLGMVSLGLPLEFRWLTSMGEDGHR